MAIILSLAYGVFLLIAAVVVYIVGGMVAVGML